MAAKPGPDIDFGDPALPVAGTGSLAHIAKSRRSRWRAAVLLSVHLLILLHVTHYLIAGTTISPVEPSESMYALELGQLNAGFIFFGLALVSTLIFGRFFCGWGCHIVMLQDFCGWLMKKVGIRPRPFRSRAMMWVPMGVALYMFVLPTVKRWVAALSLPPALRWYFPEIAPFPGFTDHLMTDSFWETFPGPLFAVLTFLTCGFAAVYFLGAKGFCTYGCPYGAFFGVVDRWAPARIRVTDDCEQCGHCTATCTSNVRVHQEVRDYGMVVDPGCMKCMDCVSVCPKDALYFGYGKPAVFLKTSAAKPKKKTGLGWKVELGLLAMTLVGAFSFRGLYDGPPLLMSVGLGAITAFLAFRWVQLLNRREVRIQNLVLKSDGGLHASGWIAGGLMVLWLTFTAHSAFVQWHRGLGAFWMTRTEATRVDVLSGRFRNLPYSDAHRKAVDQLQGHFATAARWGLLPVVEVELGLAWSDLLRDQPDDAIRRIERVIEMAPGAARQHDNLIELLVARGRPDQAIDAIRRKLASVEPTAEDWFQLGLALTVRERQAEAVDAYAAGLQLEPDRILARYHLGGLLRRLGRNDEAIEQLERVHRDQPEDADTRVELGLAYRAAGRNQEAVEEFRSAIALNPQSPESRLYLPGLIQEIEAGLPGTSTRD